MTKSEKEKEHFNKLAEERANHWWGSATKTGQYREEYRARLLEKKISDMPDTAEFKILEIGCSGGSFTLKFAKRLAVSGKAAKIFAVDISDRLIQLAQKKDCPDNVSFQVCDAEKLPFDEEHFDIVCGNAILHHLNLDIVIPEIKRVLKRGGKIIFFEPNLLNPEVFAVKKIKFLGRILQDSPDETAFIGSSIKKKIKGHGFTDVKILNFDFYHPLIPFSIVSNFNFLFKFLERAPLIKNISGSLLISGLKNK